MYLGTVYRMSATVLARTLGIVRGAILKSSRPNKFSVEIPHRWSQPMTWQCDQHYACHLYKLRLEPLLFLSCLGLGTCSHDVVSSSLWVTLKGEASKPYPLWSSCSNKVVICTQVGGTKILTVNDFAQTLPSTPGLIFWEESFKMSAYRKRCRNNRQGGVDRKLKHYI